MNGPNPVGIIFWLGMMIWAFCILANKRRGFDIIFSLSYFHLSA